MLLSRQLLRAAFVLAGSVSSAPAATHVAHFSFTLARGGKWQNMDPDRHAPYKSKMLVANYDDGEDEESQMTRHALSNLVAPAIAAAAENVRQQRRDPRQTIFTSRWLVNRLQRCVFLVAVAALAAILIIWFRFMTTGRVKGIHGLSDDVLFQLDNAEIASIGSLPTLRGIGLPTIPEEHRPLTSS